MALKKLYEKYSQDFPYAYWRIMGGKFVRNGVEFEVWIFYDPNAAQDYQIEASLQPRIDTTKYVLDKKTYFFETYNADQIVPASNTVFNWAYLLLKTLPEFTDAEDV